jgi:hypothetical protein
MSEYQYYEFQAIDRHLDRTAQEALRSISSRARITATRFTNHYEWGDFRGDPRKLVEQWFDLHLYFANWGSRRLIMRLPARLLDRAKLEPFLCEADWVEVWASGDNLIVDICPDEAEDEAYDGLDDGSDWLAELAPLRGDVLEGDLRLFYLLWLTAVQYELVADDVVEPLPGIGPLTAPLDAFAEFFSVDLDLMQAAAERDGDVAAVSKDDLRETLAVISESEKAELLLRIIDGDAHVAAEFKSRARAKRPVSTLRRTAGELRIRAREIAEARERADAERREAERRRKAEETERARRARLNALRQRGADVWREIDEEIERRNASGYDRAASLLFDLQALATEEGRQGEFDRRLASIRAEHDKKAKFLERLTRIGRDNDEGTA